MFDPALRQVRSERRVAEFEASGACMCVTYCMSSCNTLTGARTFNRVRHVLELCFETPVDHEAYQKRTGAMWKGEWGAYNAYRLEHAHILGTGEDHGHEDAKRE